MIITRIAATNAFKYNHLEIDDIPAQGVIAVSGDNESGKSSVGEIICFALFGQTYSLPEEEIGKAIRWGELSCSMSVCFAIDEDREYEVYRHLDEDGKAAARLTVRGESEPLAVGMQPVTEAVIKLVGFDFDEFLETFYLAQREIIKPQSQGDAIKSIAGLSLLERVREKLEDENDNEGSDAEELQQRISEIGTEQAELNIDHTLLKRFKEQRSGVQQALERVQEASKGLEGAANNYREAVESGDSGAGGGVIFLRLLTLLAAVGFGLLWYLMERMPDANITQSLAPTLGELGVGSVHLLTGGSIAALLFIIFLFVGGSSKARAERLKTPAIAVARKLRDGWAIQGEGSSGETTSLRQEQIERVSERMEGGLASVEEMDPLVEAEVARLAQVIAAEKEKVGALDKAIKQEQSRLNSASVLQQEQQELEAKLAQIARNAELRDVARHLLNGAEKHVIKRFNADLREFAARTLPLFTSNRYEHLRVEGDLNVRVFSNRKRDFMDLAEISAGTQRQIMLALRLALAKELADTTVVGRQFMFLDEPFAFFDQTRTRDTLKVLPSISEKLSQVWVVNQEFSDEHPFALHLCCKDENGELVGHGEQSPKISSSEAPPAARPSQPESSSQPEEESSTSL